MDTQTNSSLPTYSSPECAQANAAYIEQLLADEERFLNGEPAPIVISISHAEANAAYTAQLIAAELAS